MCSNYTYSCLFTKDLGVTAEVSKNGILIYLKLGGFDVV